MKKFILLIMLILLTSGCTNYDEEYYTKVADTAVSFFRNDTFNKEDFYENEQTTLTDLLTKITHNGEEVNLSDFIDEESSTSESNSNNVYLKDNTCYMSYDNLKAEFDRNTETDVEPFFEGVCNNKQFIVFESDLYPPYEETTSNPRYDYVLLKNEKESDRYNFYYRSTYDGSGLQVSLILEKKQVKSIEMSFVNVDGIVQGE